MMLMLLIACSCSSKIIIAELMTVIIVSVSSQNLATCRASVDCNGVPSDDLGPADPRDCCVGNPRGMAYVPREGACIACVVVGFINTTFSGVEQRHGHSIQVGYQKGAAIARQNLVFTVENTPGTAKEGSLYDYTVNTLRARALWPMATTPDNVVVTFRVDAIAQEPNETFTLTLIPVDQPNAREGLFFLNTSQVTIVDNDIAQFTFTEDDFRAIESNTRGLPVLVTKSARIAARVELKIIPYTVQEAILQSVPLPPNIPQDDLHSPPFANLNDFNNTNITIVFEADEDAEVNEKSAPIFVIDDDINEANEQVFVVELILINSSSPVDLSARPTSLCRIIDNDPIRIGFEQPGYTYKEPLLDEFIDEFHLRPPGRSDLSGPIYLVKENNVTSEQTFRVSIEVTDSAPSDSPIQAATFGVDYRFGGAHRTSETLSFNAFEQRINVLFELVADTLPEGNEAFQASVSPEDTRVLTLPNGTQITERFPTSLNPINTASQVSITILDDDHIVIGFTPDNNSLSFNEASDNVTLNIRVLNGAICDGNTISVKVSTADNSAQDPSDYSSVSQVLTFNSSLTVQTVKVTIVNDLVLELSEVFTASISLVENSTIVELRPNSVSVTIIDDDELVFGFRPVEYEVNESDGAVMIEILFNLGNPGDYEALVLVSTHNGTAIEGTDFAAVSSSQVTFTVHDNQVNSLTIPIISSNSTESSEEFFVTLDEVILIHANNRTRVNLSDQERTLLILNPRRANITILDDNMAVIGFLNTNLSILEGKETLNFTIGVVQGYLDDNTFITVLFTTEEATAKAGSDYINNTKALVFSGNSALTVSIQVIDDGISEPSETFFGLLSSADGTLFPPNIHLEPARATAIIINKNDLPKSAGNSSTITVIVVVVPVCVLVFLILIAAIVIVICCVIKKSKRKMQDLQEEPVYDTVSPPPATHTSLSKSTKLVDYEFDDAKQKTSGPKIELMDNVAYSSYKPVSTAENTPKMADL